MSPTAFVLRNRAVIFLLFFLMMGLGIVAFFSLSRREDPDIQGRFGQIIALYPGASGTQVEQLVTDPLERTVLELDDVKTVTSTTRPGIAVLQVEVADRIKDIPKFWRDMRERISDNQGSLPANVSVSIDDRFADVAAMIFGITWPGATDRQREDEAKSLRDLLRAQADVAEVKLLGEQEEVVTIAFASERMARYGITPSAVRTAVADRNILPVSGGSLAPGVDRLALQPTGEIKSPSDLGEILVATSGVGGAPVYLRDIATITRGYADPSPFRMRVNGEPAVGVSLTMRKGRNLTALGQQVQKAITFWKAGLPPGVAVTLINDLPRSVERRMGEFTENLLSGVLLIFAVMGLFMGLRSALIVGALVPITIVGTFLAMWLCGRDIQQISISALIISLGLVVDNSIVVIDNIEKKLSDGGLTREQAVIEGTDELRIPLLTSNLTTVASFAPILLLSGGVGEFIRDLGLVTSLATLVSLLLNVTMAPLLALAFLRPHGTKRTLATRFVDGFIGGLRSGLSRLARRGLRRPGLTVALALIGFAVSVAMIPRLGSQFFPSAERNQFTIDIFLPEGRDISATGQTAKRVEKFLGIEPGIVSYATYLGQGGPRFYYNVSPEPPAPNYAQIVVNTRSIDDTKNLVAKIQREADTEISEGRVTVRSLEQGPPIGAPIAIRLSGPEVGALRRLAGAVATILNGIPGAASVYSSYGDLPLAVTVKVDEDRAARAGLSSSDVAQATQMGFSGQTLSYLREGDKQIPILMRLADWKHAGTRRLLDEYVPTRRGTVIPLRQVTSLSLAAQDGRIVRRNHLRTVTVFAFTDGSRLPSQVLAEARKRLAADLALPSGYTLSYGGEDEQAGQSLGEIGLVLVLTVMTNLIIVVWEFRSVRIGLSVLAAIPFSLIGAVFGLFVTHQNFGLMAFLGITSLAGVVTNHAIVFFEYARVEQKRGIPMTDALLNAGGKRLRPILLTVLLSIFGVLPQAVNGGNLWPPLAWSLIFGLAASLVLTLVVVPSVYQILSGGKEEVI